MTAESEMRYLVSGLSVQSRTRSWEEIKEVEFVEVKAVIIGLILTYGLILQRANTKMVERQKNR